MKKVFLMISIICMLLLVGCEGAKLDNRVENQKMTLKLSTGERTGIYSGYVENGIPQWEGTFESVNDENEKWTYVGSWENGLMEGYGTTEFEDGDKYEGEYKAGEWHGKGSYYRNGELLFSGVFENGYIIELDRKKFVISENEQFQYVQLKTMGFQIPQSWEFEYTNDECVTISIPNVENVAITCNVLENTNLKDGSVGEAIKNSVLENLGQGYSSCRLVSEDYGTKSMSSMSTYDFHAILNEKNLVTDIYTSAVYRDPDVYLVTIQEVGVADDYYEAATCIHSTMKRWDAIEDDIARDENRQEVAIAEQYLNGDVDWDKLEKVAPKVVAEQIIKHRAPKEQTVLVEGIIYNVTEETFDLWIPYEETYYLDTGWEYGISLNGISAGDIVEICINTHSDGSFNMSDGIMAIRKVNQESIYNILDVYKETCPMLDYKTIMRNPEKAYGTSCKTYGTVFQVVNTKSYMQEFLLKLEDGNFVYMKYHKDEKADNVLENDKIIAYGMYYMTETYKTLLGEEKTVPSLVVNYVDIEE